MPSMEHWISFVLATAIFACMPGPAILYMTAQTLAHGRKAGFLAALGIHIGCYVHIAAAALGLAALLHHALLLYTVIKLAGAVYLIWLGATMLLGAGKHTAHTGAAKPGVLRDSIVVEILNPKTALFFVTFLPQFVDPTASMPLSMQFLMFGLLVNLALSIADVAAVFLASFTLGRLTGSGSRLVPRACGSILIALGLMLAGQPV
ncbi:MULTISPECIES: LysE family translocator [unclassified Ensifer]|uniref:LysE family translocator n=1 Tax=unclassified Ensifer TaxID=2633371 RepID=UPI000812C02C|nr:MULTISPECIES: LysE family translocator [unclassified Ensifer]OCO99125.1 amino acid transporter [Ensifer sp. LC11]OCO99330.1 amino acid transporter [Ensifer sp. LC13]OCP12920.1 amino acid transporter [Ensifer sp. LC14]OCP29631.1 amino acid transporter [Ensifer sp. LC499]